MLKRKEDSGRYGKGQWRDVVFWLWPNHRSQLVCFPALGLQDCTSLQPALDAAQRPHLSLLNCCLQTDAERGEACYTFVYLLTSLTRLWWVVVNQWSHRGPSTNLVGFKINKRQECGTGTYREEGLLTEIRKKIRGMWGENNQILLYTCTTFSRNTESITIYMHI